MAQSLSHKVVASPENSLRSYYEASFDGYTCFKIPSDSSTCIGGAEL